MRKVREVEVKVEARVEVSQVRVEVSQVRMEVREEVEVEARME